MNNSMLPPSTATSASAAGVPLSPPVRGNVAGAAVVDVAAATETVDAVVVGATVVVVVAVHVLPVLV